MLGSNQPKTEDYLHQGIIVDLKNKLTRSNTDYGSKTEKTLSGQLRNKLTQKEEDQT